MDIIEAPSPELIGPYRILRSIAQGGMAAVYEAEEPKEGKRVAVKLLIHRGLARPRFAREYRALTRLNHPNIVRVYQFGVHEGNPYLSMELIRGEPIQVFAKAIGRPGNRKRTEEVSRLLAEVATALHYLHQRAIVHRDLKSSNILVLPDGRAKLLDFGTARYLSGDEAVTRQGEFVGTFAYASPEQISGDHVDGRSDLYSMGVLLYRLLTGKRPFDADSPHELARMHVERKPTPPSKLVPAIPAALDELTMRLLEKDPADRPANAQVVAEFLKGQSSIKSAAPETLGPGRLVGRDDIMETIRERLDKPEPGSMILMVGPEGSGRARVMRMAVASARQKGIRTFGGNFGGERGIGILSEVVEDVRHSLEGHEVPAESQFWAEMRMRATSRLEGLYLDMLESLVRRCKADVAPVVIALGDMHRASPSALEAIAYMRQKLRELEAPVMFLGTTPDDSDAPGGAIRRRLPDATRMELRPLNAGEVRELAGSILGGRPLSRDLSQRIYQVTSGLPGYIGEVLRAMVQGGVLSPILTEHGIHWEERTGGKLDIPTTARDATSLRIDGLGIDRVRVLECLAVAGGASAVQVLAYGLERDTARVQLSLDELESMRLIESFDSGEGELWRFKLALTRELILERLRPLWQALFARRLADVSLQAPPSPEKIHLLLNAGRIDQAIEDAVVWAEPHLDWSRAEETAPVLEHVADLAHGAREVDRATLCRLYMLLGRARLALRAGNREAEAALQRAAALATDGTLRAEVELFRARGLLSRGRIAEAKTLLEKAGGRLSDDHPKLASRIAMELGVLYWYLGDFLASVGHYEDALDAARRGGWSRLVARALAGRGVLRLCRGQLSLADEDLREAVRLFTLAGDRSSMWQSLGNLGDILRRKGAFTESLALLDGELSAVREGGNWIRQALFVLNLAETEVELHRLGRARERIEELTGDMDFQEHLHMRGAVCLLQGRIALTSGDAALAIATLEPIVEECKQAGMHVVTAQLMGLLGEALVKTDRRSEGMECFSESFQMLQEQGHLPSLGEACAARARAMGDREDPDISYAPVLHWMEEEPVRMLRLQYLVASARFAESCNKRGRAQSLWLEAQALFSEVLGGLGEQERESMRVHPMAVAIERGQNL